jgi:hypothetical protein
VTCRYCGQSLHKGEPYIQSSLVDVQLHIDCYLKRQATRRPDAFMARLKDILGAQVVLH